VPLGRRERRREKGEEKGEGRREKGEGRREKGEGRREKGEGRREKGEGRKENGDEGEKRKEDRGLPSPKPPRPGRMPCTPSQESFRSRHPIPVSRAYPKKNYFRLPAL
jgi:hypothetical protein